MTDSALKYFYSSVLFVFLLAISSTLLWQTTYKQQLAELKESAQRNLVLYGSKIDHELNQIQRSLLPIITNHPKIKSYLSNPSIVNQTQAQQYLQQLQLAMPNRALFIGNAKQFLLASDTPASDLAMLESIKQIISSRTYKRKSTEQFVFTKNNSQDKKNTSTKYVIALPIYQQNKIKNGGGNNTNDVSGYVGLLIDLSKLQKELNNSLLSKNQVVLLSDQRGIIMLSSETSWLYRTFSNLPYNLKKKLDEQFAEKQLFNQLGIADIDDDILTTSTAGNNEISESFLVFSTLLSNYPLRIHHLANIAPVVQRSNFYVAFMIISLVLITLLWLFYQEMSQAQVVKTAHQRQLKDFELEFKQQQKLASMGMMATTVAHEINQPITAIKTEALVGLKYLERHNTEEVTKSFSTIVEYTKLLSAISAQLKNFARKGNTNVNNVANIYQVIKHSLALNDFRLQTDHVNCLVSGFDHGLNAKIDEHQLQQVFNNLLQNSCDALKNTTNKQINIQVSLEDSIVIILFSDNGPGIASAIQENIFAPFVSSKGNASSIGLGLAICDDILSKVGGHIELQIRDTNEFIETEQLCGATFKISLLSVLPKV